MLGRFDPLRIAWHASGQAGYGLNLGNVAAVAAPYIRRNRPTKTGRTGRANRMRRVLRMSPIPNGSAWPRENDSHSQDLRHLGRILRMIPILTREGPVENDSHFQ